MRFYFPVMKILKTAFLVPAVACLGLLCACGGDEDKDNGIAPTATVTVSTDALAFDADGGSAAIDVSTTGREWDAAASDSWFTLRKSGTASAKGSVSVTADKNNDYKERTATIKVMSGTSNKVVTVTQAARQRVPVNPEINVPEGYELVWNDEFDKAGSLDRSSWTHEVQGAGWVNNELQTYVNESFNGMPVTEVADGKLLIHCFKQGDKVYSGRVYANVSKGWKYGIFEAAVKLPKGRGTWPAFWMMPANNDFGVTPWPKCGEIDIMEEVGFHPDYTSSSIHCESYNHTKGTQKTAERHTEGAEDDFHIYRLEWTADAITTYVDGKQLLTFANDGRGQVSTWPFNKPFYLILNLAWGGDWGGAQGVDETALPATMEVEYVRVFQKM